MSKQYGPVVGLVLGGESVILVTEGHAAQQVLISKAATYKKVRSPSHCSNNSLCGWHAYSAGQCMLQPTFPAQQGAARWSCGTAALQASLQHPFYQLPAPILKQSNTYVDSAATHLQEGTAFFPGSSLAGQGLLVSDGAIWQRQRQLTNPAFRRAAVEAYAAVRPGKLLPMLHTSAANMVFSRPRYAEYAAFCMAMDDIAFSWVLRRGPRLQCPSRFFDMCNAILLLYFYLLVKTAQGSAQHGCVLPQNKIVCLTRWLNTSQSAGISRSIPGYADLREVQPVFPP